MIKRSLKDALPEKCFWINCGPVVKNLEELKDALKTMSNDQFYYHVNSGNNDFAKWVREVLGENEVSRRLGRIKTRLGAFKLLERELSFF